MVSDGSWMVRVQAAKTLVREQDEASNVTYMCLLIETQTQHSGGKLVVESFLVCQGSMLQVSPHFLEQTLDKKLMSDLRVSN